ncbi:hypothetical protein BDD12DRAFT_822878 [Trichophaea hybrida]|nr:hypothetical protein BDD12DRAFT_822878 [Trichophaea hybrida]
MTTLHTSAAYIHLQRKASIPDIYQDLSRQQFRYPDQTFSTFPTYLHLADVIYLRQRAPSTIYHSSKSKYVGLGLVVLFISSNCTRNSTRFSSPPLFPNKRVYPHPTFRIVESKTLKNEECQHHTH